MPALKCVSTLRISIWHSKGLERDYMYTNTGSSVRCDGKLSSQGLLY